MDTVAVRMLDNANGPYSWVPLASLVVAALASIAAIISPIMSRRTTRQQIISTSRQDWLNKVRLKVAKHLQLTTILHGKTSLSRPYRVRQLEALVLLEYQLELLLNTSEANQASILLHLRELRDICIDKQRLAQYVLYRDRFTKEFASFRDGLWKEIKKGR